MKADIAYVQEKFREFNRRMFDGKLPELPISVTNAKSYLGVCLYRNRFKWNGKREYYDFKLRISRRIDLSQDELDDTIIHEMIHYWIGLFSPDDMPGHSPLFRKMMTDINQRFGRNIRVSHRLSAEQLEQAIDNRPKKHVVARVVLKDGRTGIKVIPCLERHIRRYRRGMMASGKVSSIKFYQTTDPFFNRFPSSSAFKVYFLDPEIMALHIPDCDKLTDKF
jgi:hypothetical protein